MMEILLSLISVVNIIWTIPLLLVIGLITYDIEKVEEGFWISGLSLVGFIIYLSFFANTQFLIVKDYLASTNIILNIIIYLIIGSIWTVYKFWRFVSNYKFNNYDLSRIKEDGRKYFIVMVDDRKSTIIKWMLFWPISIISTLLFDIVVDAVNGIFKLLQNLFVTMLENAFKNTLKNK